MKKQPTINHSAVHRITEIVSPRAARRSRFGRHLDMNALALAAAGWAAFALPLTAAPMSPGFTYQGRLYDNGSVASGLYDFQFTLVAGGNAATPVTTAPYPNPVTIRNVSVTNGVFTTTLYFGSEPFDGSARWLRVAVSPPGVEAYATLQPMHEITVTPYALHADTAESAVTAQQADQAAHAATADTAASVPWNNITGVPTGIGNAYTAGAGLSLTGDAFRLDDASLSGARYDGRFWKLGGNASVPSGMNLFGTMTNLPLDLMANSQRILRLEPTTSSPNLIGGYSGNLATLGVAGGTVGGGGYYWTGDLGLIFDERNHVTDSYGTVAGGNQNRAGNNSGTTSDARYATVGGGHINTAAGAAATVSGGENNYAMGGYAAVPGGSANSASGDYSFAAGRRAKAVNPGSFVWADSTAADYSSTANNQFSVRANGGIKLDGNTSINGDLSLNGNINGHMALNGNVYTLDHDLRLRSFGDINHGVGFRSTLPTLPGITLDGPFLYGNLGGALGTRAGDSVALRWDNGGNVTVSHNLSTATLTIRGGADLAEPFKMSGKDVPQGAVVVIDEENPGQLKMSSRAYDTQVAGIVSGANGVNPGISLSQEGVLEGGQNVALTGRVYVQADAAFGAIKPGDLLTTSDTPGCAMKVGDHAQAQGAILGKAMSTLEAGTGFVLVLVSLQ